MRQNGDVYVSIEMLAILLAAASLVVALCGGLFAGFAWMLRRMDERFAQAEVSINERFAQTEVSVNDRFNTIDERFAAVDKRFNKIDENFDWVHQGMDDLRSELTEVKISVARLEGPRPRLIMPR